MARAERGRGNLIGLKGSGASPRESELIPTSEPESIVSSTMNHASPPRTNGECLEPPILLITLCGRDRNIGTHRD